jgi:hypothetical protein
MEIPEKEAQTVTRSTSQYGQEEIETCHLTCWLLFLTVFFIIIYNLIVIQHPQYSVQYFPYIQDIVFKKISMITSSK